MCGRDSKQPQPYAPTRNVFIPPQPNSTTEGEGGQEKEGQGQGEEGQLQEEGRILREARPGMCMRESCWSVRACLHVACLCLVPQHVVSPLLDTQTHTQQTQPPKPKDTREYYFLVRALVAVWCLLTHSLDLLQSIAARMRAVLVCCLVLHSGFGSLSFHLPALPHTHQTTQKDRYEEEGAEGGEWVNLTKKEVSGSSC